MSTPDIHQYLPHRPPFVMIDTISLDADEVAHSSFKIGQNILLEGEFFSAAGLVENIAQTAGAATGLRAEAQGQAQMGYIGAVKDLRIERLPQKGQTVLTAVTFVHQVMNVLIVRGEALCEGELCASCELKIFLQV